jgi:hypothetical protein
MADECELATFVDDIAIFVSNSEPMNVCDGLQSQLDLLTDYFEQWKRIVPALGLCLTARKCHGLRRSNIWEWLSIRDWHLRPTQLSRLRRPRRLSEFFTRFSIENRNYVCTINKSCIRPILCYGVETWYNCAATHKKKLQNKCLKIIKNRHWRYSTFDFHQETNIPIIEAFGEKIYGKFMQRCRFSENPLILEFID